MADDIDSRLADIAAEHEWSVLLHYEKGWLKTRSLVDDPAFFLSPDGKYDRLAELKALYEAVYVHKAQGDEYAACRFPARAEFLAQSLGRPVSELNLMDCKDLQNFMLEVNPVSASIIFPFYHMNSPASMFGHTLLRFDSDQGTELTSVSVTYAADYNKNDNGIAYAIKGVTGMYAGRTQVVPYHEKIREYDNINQRDIWEYRLNMTKSEVRTMALHAYEMQNVWSKYYFFDENCSYNLLFMIEAARPDTMLTEDFLWVIPVDTVYVMQQKGLLGEMTYRPSQSARMKWMLAHMDDRTYNIAITAIKTGKLGDYSALDDRQKMLLLDFWTEYTMFTNRNDKDNKQYSKELIGVLRQRAKIHDAIDYHLPVPPEPLTGHRPSRLSIGAGSDKGQAYQEIGWRPALHTLDDNDTGYLTGSSLSFFDVTLRHKNTETYLQKLSFVDIYSLSPVNELFDPVSWKANFGLEHIDRYDSTAAFLNPGAGKAYNVFGGLLYGLFTTKLQVSTAYTDVYSAGAGYQAGYLRQTGSFKLRAGGDFMRFGMGELHKEGHFTASAEYYPVSSSAITVRAAKSVYGGSDIYAGYSLFY